MAIRCGNCRENHDTIQQVRECHGSKAGPSPTEKQVSYLKSLVVERTDHGITDVDAVVKDLSRDQASELIDRLLAKPKVEKSAFPADISGEIPKHGTYTVVFADDSYITIRIRKPHPKANFVVAEYLFGPDNTSDFRRFAREAVGGFRVNPGGDKESQCVLGLKALVSASEKELADMGFKYALASGNCYRCGRTLTVPASVSAGLGPKCARMEA